MGSRLEGFAWATAGRREAPHEIEKKLHEQRARVDLLPARPRFLFVIREGADTDLTLESLERQSYPHWKAVVVGAGENPVLADGCDWIGVLASGEVLNPAALFLFAAEIGILKPDLIYANEVLCHDGWKRPSFLSKPGPSDLTLWHLDYVGRPWVISRSSWISLGGMPAGDHDLLLRAREAGLQWASLPYYLCHRRWRGVLPAPDPETVRSHLVRRGISADVRLDGARLRVTPRVEAPLGHRISAIICFRDRAEWTIRAATALSRIAGEIPLEILLVDNDSSAAERKRVERGVEGLAARVIPFPGGFNFAQMHNRVVAEHARGDVLLLLNNDVFLDPQGRLDEWAAWALHAGVGTVGMLLRYAHGGVQHGGIRARFGGEARLVRVGHEQGEDALTTASREVFANTFAAAMVKRSTYEALGGLRAWDVANGFGDVAFNLECVQRGLCNLFLGGISGIHLESASRGLGYEYWEELEIERRFPGLLQRMLRSDLGLDRVPEPDYSLRDFLGQYTRARLRRSAPWLDPLRTPVKKILRLAGMVLKGARQT